MLTTLILCFALPPVAPPMLTGGPAVAPPLIAPCAGCDCGCAEGAPCACTARARGIGLPWKVYRIAIEGELYPRYFVSNRIPPRSDDAVLYRDIEDARWRCDLLNGSISYSAWKRGLKGRDVPTITPPAMTYRAAPAVFAMPAMRFGGSFSGGNCAGGG